MTLMTYDSYDLIYHIIVITIKFHLSRSAVPAVDFGTVNDEFFQNPMHERDLYGRVLLFEVQMVRTMLGNYGEDHGSVASQRFCRVAEQSKRPSRTLTSKAHHVIFPRFV